MNKLAALVILAAACGGKSTPTTPGNTGGGASGPVYAALLEQGARWSFALTHKVTPPVDDGPPTTEAAGAMTCTVAMAHPMGDLQLSKIECVGEQAPGDGFAPAGYWVASPAGLWHLDGSLTMDEVHAQVAALDPKKMLIAATPAAHSDQLGDLDNGDGLEVFAAKPGAGGGWCVAYTMAMGDEAGWELCLTAGAIASGSWFSAGATVDEMSYVAQ
ncbi:MAG: hypothetical protein IPL61_26890 [Myxococcales bacterium]|nr:hypothetical protein [Myxococcales bacterium]